MGQGRTDIKETTTVQRFYSNIPKSHSWNLAYDGLVTAQSDNHKAAASMLG